MISYKELMGSHVISDISMAHQQNLQELCKRINVIRTLWDKPMIVTSGYRSEQEHLRIYAKKGILDRALIPMRSNHLIGAACDIADSDGALMSWLKSDLHILEGAGLWCEDDTNGWVHFQIFPPRSGKRFFKP